ncbi:TPA: hypothetical protein ACMDT9_003561 [Vibrio parahaemolyticus]
MMNVLVTGSVLRDKNDSSLRNYVNLVFTIQKGASKIYYHVRNWRMNSKTNAHRMTADRYESHDEAMRAWQEIQNKKINRNRVETLKVMEEFGDLSKLERWMSGPDYRFTIANIKKLRNRFETRVAEASELEGMSFEEKMERQLEEASDFSKIEREAGVGKSTAEFAGASWGMF